MNALKTLYQDHDGKISIKWESYIAEYDRLFCEIRDQPVRILEIGIQNGGSLELWGKYFAQGIRFVGCDIDQKCSLLSYEDPRIAVVVGDINEKTVRDSVIKQAESFSVIIDDGSHISGDIVKSFINYFNLLDNGGIYIVEDIHASYWQEYQGGLYFPYSSMSFFKRMADVINHDSWKTSKSINHYLEKLFQHLSIAPDVALLAGIHSIEFVNSMCIIRKDCPENNGLGDLLVAGEHALITPGYKQSGFNIVFPDQSGNPWSTLPEAPDEALASSAKKIHEMENALHDFEKCVGELNSDILNLKSSIHTMQHSLSWRLTKPLRYLKKIAVKYASL